VDTFALCEWLLGHFGDDPRVLASKLCRSALTLLEAVTLALKGRRRDEQLELADERLIALRTLLRLAAAAGYLTDAQVIYGLDRADAVGRQLGGWLRALGPV
jgi:hypothetical protein